MKNFTEAAAAMTPEITPIGHILAQLRMGVSGGTTNSSTPGNVSSCTIPTYNFCRYVFAMALAVNATDGIRECVCAQNCSTFWMLLTASISQHLALPHCPEELDIAKDLRSVLLGACRHHRKPSFPSTCGVEVTAGKLNMELQKDTLNAILCDALLSTGTCSET